MSRRSLPAPLAAIREASNEASGDRPSKSQRKREMTALQALGESLLQLSEAALARVEMPDDLRAAVAEAARIKSHEARRRQLQYIGRLVRQLDAEQLRAAIENATGESKQAVALMHRCERLRDRLLDDDAALAEVLDALPRADVQSLRAMIRAARREHGEGRPPKHARQLYRWLHEHLAQAMEAA
jgi:ribosome-associated protein